MQTTKLLPDPGNPIHRLIKVLFINRLHFKYDKSFLNANNKPVEDYFTYDPKKKITNKITLFYSRDKKKVTIYYFIKANNPIFISENEDLDTVLNEERIAKIVNAIHAI